MDTLSSMSASSTRRGRRLAKDTILSLCLTAMKALPTRGWTGFMISWRPCWKVQYPSTFRHRPLRMNTSTPILSEPFTMRRISSTVRCRSRMTREAPRSRKKAAEVALMTEAPVLTWRSTGSPSSFTRSRSPISAMMSASMPTSTAVLSSSSTTGYWSSS